MGARKKERERHGTVGLEFQFHSVCVAPRMTTLNLSQMQSVQKLLVRMPHAGSQIQKKRKSHEIGGVRIRDEDVQRQLSIVGWGSAASVDGNRKSARCICRKTHQT